MVAYDNAYSRLVAWLKIVLPLLALAILSTLFLVSRGVDPTETIPYADVDVEELAREQRASRPTYTGLTRDGSAISFAASSARPDPDSAGRVTADRLSGQIELPTGVVVNVSAAGGVIDTESQRAALEGEVEIDTSTGYSLRSNRLESSLDATSIRSDTQITGEGPLGRIEAGQMEIIQSDRTTGYVLVFKSGVKLLYEPGN